VTRTAWFAAWALLGCVIALCTLSFIGVLLFPLVILVVPMSRSRQARESVWGILTGVGALFVFVSYVQRNGPGDGHLDPLPWLMLGILLVVSGIVAHRLHRH